MKKDRREIEILAPAGSLDSLYAALKLGADAVYTGTTRFGARAFADNPGVEELTEALTYAHLRGKKIYLTVNTLLNDHELEQQLVPLITPLYEAGLDACIVQDFGALSLLHENFPDMALHASTQMTLLAADEAELYRKFGVTRFVPARECTIEEIRTMRQQTDLEIEVFVHGALCYCYSGQCFMSEVIGGRSGNRGMCAQPCRLPFDSNYGRGHLFSTKDICTLLYIPELVEAGIDSFKIEGRMKKSAYSAYISSLYRHYVDLYQSEGMSAFAELKENPDSHLWRDIRRSRDIYNRGGFSDSYLFEKEKANMMYIKKNGHYGTLAGRVKKTGKGYAVFETKEELYAQDVLEFRRFDDTKIYEYTVKEEEKEGALVTCNTGRENGIIPGQSVYRTRNAALIRWVEEQVTHVDDRLLLKGAFYGEIGKPVTLLVTGRNCTVKVSGPVLQEAKTHPVQIEDIRTRLNRMGATLYRWETLDIELPDHSFVPLGEIGKLRRRAVKEWEEKAVIRRNVCKSQADRCEPLLWQGPSLVSVSDWKQLKLALQIQREQGLIHIKLEDFLWEEWSHFPERIADRPVALSFPPILRGKSYISFSQLWERAAWWKELNIEAVLINSHRSLLLADTYFPHAVKIAEPGFYHCNRRAMELLSQFGICRSVPIVYGRKAVMVTEGCVKRTLGHCDGKKEHLHVKSSAKDEFVVVNHCDSCYNTVYTKEAMKKDLQGGCVRLDFTWESPENMRKVLGRWNLL